MSMTTPRDLFIHELSDAMSAEQQLLKLLPQFEKESHIPEVQQALQQHEQETRQQVQNIQQVFQQLGAKPDNATCFAIQGIDQEHKALKKEKPSPEILELANLDGAAKTEHYEMAMYNSLIQMATDLGERDASRLLQQNLEQERAMAKRVEGLAQSFGKQVQAGMVGAQARAGMSSAQAVT